MNDDKKTWLIVIGAVVGACLLGWFFMSGVSGSARADQLARARAAKEKKRKAAAKTAAAESVT